MTLHVLVEGPSERAFISRWAPRLVSGQEVRVYPHQGKGTLPAKLDATPDPHQRTLLHQLPAKLRSFAEALDADSDGVLILVDADDDDPAELAAKIESAVKRIAPKLRVAVRLAVEEMEAFYFGDLKALERVFPGADTNKARTYEPDSICGTWELFGEVIGDGGGNKVAWAEAMGPAVTTRSERSRSPSFRKLIEGVLNLLQTRPAKPKRRRPYRHPPKTRAKSGRRRS